MKGSMTGSSKGAGKLRPSKPAAKQSATQPAKQPAKGTGKQTKSTGGIPSAQKTRERAIQGRVTGKVTAWKGAFGWVVPDAPIDHPLAQRRGGKLYLDQADVEQELSGVGASVTFFVYCDQSGLGAERVIPNKGITPGRKAIEKKVSTAPTLVKKTIVKKLAPTSSVVKGKGKGKVTKKTEDSVDGVPDKSSRITITEAPITGVVEHWGEHVGWIRPDEPLENDEFQNKSGRRKGLLFGHVSEVEGETPLTNASVIFFAYKDDRGFGASDIQLIEQGDGVKKSKAAAEQPKTSGKVAASVKPQAKAVKKLGLKQDNSKGKGKAGKAIGKGKEQKPKGPSGPDLPRERLTDSPITGEVISFRGKFGWVQPNDALTFDGAVEKHAGKVYTHVQDVLQAETEPLKTGDSVQFHVYRDESGLGAEEVMRM